MKVSNYKPNQTLVETSDFTVLLSYDVPQVVVLHKENLVLVNDKKYSNTTSKHKNAYVRTLCDRTQTIIPALPAEIQELTGLETR